ncbi:LytR/AlgR family response regulator transcription factor [Anditalea andensis]|uniref:LytR/AlgR family response regulator transcription factor n=1 Tax=Anditalea andensis TaxID=1048983 RepID=UPI001F0B32DD|nr:response regulator transcription factor [Anditalea andensis]
MLLDDELPGLTYLKMLCEQIPELEVVKAFNSPIVFLKEAANLTFDFCILDIEMPEMSGLQVSNLLQGKPVVFATAYKHYALEAFDLNAIDYITKPIKLERLQQAVQKAITHLGKKKQLNTKNFIQVNTDKGKAILFFDRLVYIKTSDTDSRDKVARLFDGEVLVLKNISFDRLLIDLPEFEFCRINKKELISLKAVQVFTYDEISTNIFIDSGKPLKLTLSEAYKREFLYKISG